MKKSLIIGLIIAGVIIIGGVSAYTYNNHESKSINISTPTTAPKNLQPKTIHTKPKITIATFEKTNPNSKYNSIRASEGQFILKTFATYVDSNEQVKIMNNLVNALSNIPDKTFNEYSDNGTLMAISDLTDDVLIIAVPIVLNNKKQTLAFQFKKAIDFKSPTQKEIANIKSNINWNSYAKTKYSIFKTQMYNTILASLKNQNIQLTEETNTLIKKAIGSFSDEKLIYYTGVSNQNDMLVSITSKTNLNHNYIIVLNNESSIYLSLSYK